MSATATFQTAIRIARISRLIEKTGYKLVVGNDFVIYRSLRMKYTYERPIYPMFDPASSFVDKNNGFWIVLSDDTGSPVHTQAMRFIDLGGDNLKAHLSKHGMKYVTPGATPYPETASFHASKGLTEIKGRVCYKGEFWLSPDSQRLRGTGITALLSRLSLELAFETWKPDFQWALIEAKHAVGGLHTRYGYFNACPAQWKTTEGDVFADEWLIWMSRKDMVSLTKTPVEIIPDILDEQAARRSLTVVHDADIQEIKS